MKKNLVILGHHNYGISLLMENFYENYGLDIEVTIVSNLEESENKLKGIPFALPETKVKEIHYSDWQPRKEDAYFNSMMSGPSRKKIFDFFQKEFSIGMERYENSIHPMATYSKTTILTGGHYFAPHITLSPFVTLGKFTLINRNSSIGHHSEIGDYVVVAPGSNFASCVKIGHGTYVATGVTMVDGIKVGSNVLIGAHSLVTKDIPDGVVAYGVPAKIIRNNN